MTKGVFPGTFDPVTRGHVDIARRGATMFDELIVAVGANPAKRSIFTHNERMEMVREELGGIRGIRVAGFTGLLIDFVRDQGAQLVLRGVRGVTDLEYEFQMAYTNRQAGENVETLYIMPDPRYAWLNARLIREVAAMGGNVDAFVSPQVAERLKQRLTERKEQEPL